MNNSDPPAYRVDAVHQHRATITAALVGGMLSLLTCHGSRLATILYSNAMLPVGADMGESFGVGLTIMGIVAVVFLMSLIVIGLLAGRLGHPYQTVQRRFWVVLVVANLLLMGLIMAVWPLALGVGYELACIVFWIALHALFSGITVGKLSHKHLR